MVYKNFNNEMKTMDFKGIDPVSTIVMSNNTIKQMRVSGGAVG
jgi:hypothetical protein